MTAELNQDPDHPILAKAWRYEIVGLHLERLPSDGGEAFLDLTLKLGNERRSLRFWSPQYIEIERGGPCMTSGLVIKDLRQRGLDGLGVAVDDFEGTVGAVRFVARTVEEITTSVRTDVTRWLRWFDLVDDSLAGESVLAKASLPELQDLFGVDRDNPMYDCFPVDAKHVQYLQSLVAVPIELARFAYFVEADAVAG
ncbi:MAG: hypothetical protein ABI488_01040 [Polyangiaceae bacterium]